MTDLPSILYVEDDPDIKAIATMALETVGGFSVSGCESGMEAVNLIAQARPDLLILDVMMPEMDGPTTLKAIRGLPGCADIPAIFMTAKVQKSEQEALRSLGILGIIPKPFDPMTLPQTVLDIWNQRTGENVHE